MSGNELRIERFTLDRLPDVLSFEKHLREEEDCWGWEINDAYIAAVQSSFSDPRFSCSLSLLAYIDGSVAGRMDTTLILSHFDGSVKAYLDWICVLKSERHRKVAQALLTALKSECKAQGVGMLVALMASNDEAQSFYTSIEGASIHDTGIWMEI